MTPGSTAAAAVLLAVALAVSGPPAGRLRLRSLSVPPPVAQPPAAVLRPAWVAVGAAGLGALAFAVSGAVAGVVVAALAAAAGVVVMRRSAANRAGPGDAAELAGRWELLAVCLEAGMPVASALSATAAPLAGTTGTLLRRVAGLLELGADPDDAWQVAADAPALATFARAAGRSAGTGAALAQVARVEGARIRAELVDTAQERAQRAAVLITGPLGLCYLPAFLVLGIAPVVVGLAGEALARW